MDISISFETWQRLTTERRSEAGSYDAFIRRLLGHIPAAGHERTNEPHGHINAFWSAIDDCWIADIPDLNPCSAHGDTPAEAVADAETATALWLDVARDRNMTIPKPRYRPAIYAT